MEDFEKLGAFYLGRVQDLAAGKRTDELVLYDSKDLTTHAVIIGMTGSGKTGLGIGLIEEAAIDRIPVIAIDPKGDLGNLLLTFPELRPADFEPWVSAQEAEAKGLTREKFAEEQASTWEKGLADWGQSADRIKRLREAADFAIYTPGSTAGTPLSVLRGSPRRRKRSATTPICSASGCRPRRAACWRCSASTPIRSRAASTSWCRTSSSARGRRGRTWTCRA